jgi:uncharacterized membrane protein YqjE
VSASYPAPPAARGLLDALRVFGRTLNETLHVRGALFALEVREEVERRKAMLLLAALGAAFLHLALLLAALLVVVAFWDTHRIAATAAMAGLYLACGVAAFLALRARIAASPEPFAATVGELERDLAELHPAP